MEDVIERVVSCYVPVIPVKKFQCDIEMCDGAVSGCYTYGFFKKKTGDIGDLKLDWDTRSSIRDLLDELDNHKDDRNCSPHKMILSFDQTGKYNYQIQYPNLQFTKLDEIDKTHGLYPNYIYINITKELIAELDEFSTNQLIPIHIEEARKLLKFNSDVEYSQSISHEFYLLMLNIRVEGEINSGGFDHLYGIFSDSPSSIIVDIHNSFQLLGNIAWLEIIEESIQLYSHFHNNVEEARQMLSIEPVEKKTESDIMDRYYGIEPSLEGIRCEYIKGNPDKFTKVLINN